MIRISFNAKEIEKLRQERFYHPSVKVQQKMEAVYLKSMGVRHNEICRLCGISKPTLITYLKEYQEGGIKQLKESTIYKGTVRPETTVGKKPEVRQKERMMA